MEQKDFDIYEILKGMPDGTPLYTPLCGNVEFTSVAADKEKAEAIWTEDKNGEYAFDKNGRWMKGGEVLLFPSKEMRDWSKFFKKGDVLVFQGVAMKVICIFEKYEDETLVRFRCRHASKNGNLYSRQTSFETEDWVKSENPDSYIKFVEDRLGGILNLETLEIEKAQQEFKDGDVLFVKCYDSAFIEIFKYSKNNGDLYDRASLDTTNQILDISGRYRIGKDEITEIRLATEAEKQQLFSALKKEGKAWDSEKKAIVDLKPKVELKPFDKVLVRSGREFNWYPALFVRDRGDNYEKRYIALPIHIGTAADFASCIPFEGHENIAFTNYDIENLPF